MTERMQLLKTVQFRTATHECPDCKGPAYCAMEDGKSANLCWCMDVKPVSLSDNDRCVCQPCLIEQSSS